MMLAMMAFMVVKVGNTYYISHIKNERDKSTSPVIYVIHVCLCVCASVSVQVLARYNTFQDECALCLCNVLFLRVICRSVCSHALAHFNIEYSDEEGIPCVSVHFSLHLCSEVYCFYDLSLLLFGAAQVCVCLCASVAVVCCST